MTRTTRRLTVGIAAALVLGLAGCNGETSAAERPSEAPTASASPTTSPSPTRPSVEKPERPAAMDDDGPAGAEAAAKYFLQLDPYMQATGDTTESAAMSHPECATCAERLKQAADIAAAGYVWSGGETEVSIVHTYEQDPTFGIWPIDVRVHDAPATVTDSQGRVVFESPSADFTQRVEIARRDGVWVVVGIAELPGN